MNIDEITVEIVFKALKIIRSAGRLSVSPLVELDLVRLRLRGEGVHDSPEGRALDAREAARRDRVGTSRPAADSRAADFSRGAHDRR